jgi:diguanylate cyclase (GGDEF)-like protein
LTDLRAIRALSNAEAGQHAPVDFEATVTYFRWYTRELFVQDGDSAIFVYLGKDAKVAPGDRVRVRGFMQPSFRPVVQSSDVTLLRHGSMPSSVTVNYNDLIDLKYICRRVTLHAQVQSVNLTYSSDHRSTYMHLRADGNAVDFSVESDDPQPLKDLLDAEVEVSGVAGIMFDSKMEARGVMLHANSMADVKILKRATASPWALPVTPANEIFNARKVSDLSDRLHVHGIITYYRPGAAVVLQDGPRSLWIDTQAIQPLQIGDEADATGFPDVHNGFLSLVHGEILDSGRYAPLAPLPETWERLSKSNNIQFGHIYDLVSIEGKVITAAREADRDEYVLSNDGRLFTAIYYHPSRATQLPVPPMKEIPVGSTVRVSGICGQLSSNPWNGTVPFDILLRNFDDISVISRPPWLSTGNLVRVVIVLLLAVIAIGAWGIFQMRMVHIQTAVAGSLERRRARILEEINGSQTLARILEDIAELVSFQLKGAPCWCEMANGGRWGVYPPNLAALRVVQKEIAARSGPPLGTFFAALDPLSKSSSDESEALSTGAHLATLAMESRQLLSDLVHRSEFDLLTNTHNRFSLEQQLDDLIEKARRRADIFGLVYIDLDGFKQVNDQYGHHIGDLYLQEVVRRMKRQLRPKDLLARLGGDEFVVLLPEVRSRAHVEEIALRLECCFLEPLPLEGNILLGTASFGLALYPENGANQHDLLGAADAAMYAVKNTKKKNEWPAEPGIAGDHKVNLY